MALTIKFKKTNKLMIIIRFFKEKGCLERFGKKNRCSILRTREKKCYKIYPKSFDKIG